MRERIVSIRVHGRFCKKVLRDAKYDYVTIYVRTRINFCTADAAPMIKEFHAAIMGSEVFGLSANFTHAELKWEADEVIYNPI